MAFGIAGIQAGFIDDLYREHNNYRRQNGLSPLRTDSTIEYYLKQLGSVSYEVGHNHDQIPNLEGKLRFSLNVIAAIIFTKNNFFCHLAYNKRCTGYIGVRENIHWSYSLDAKKVMNGWKSSPGHNANILTSNVSHLQTNSKHISTMNNYANHFYFQGPIHWMRLH